MEADEEITRFRTVATPVTQSDQGIRGPRHLHSDAAALQFSAQEQAHLEGNVLLSGSSRKEDARISGVDAPVPWINGHDVPRSEPVRQSVFGGDGGLRGGH